MSLQTLLEGWRDEVPQMVIEGITLDLRQVRPGMAFIAVAGQDVHGLHFAPQAESAGAAVVLHDGQFSLPPLGIPCVEVPGLGQNLSSLASRFFHAPSEHLSITGIAGDKGKSCTAHFLTQAWQRATGNAGLMYSPGDCTADGLASSLHAPRDPIALQQLLSDCVDQGMENLAMEVSSQALAQGCHDEIRFEAGVFTNLGRNQEKDQVARAEAVRSLFADCKPRFAVINRDDATGSQLISEFGSRLQVLSYGTGPGAELSGSVLAMDSSGMSFAIDGPWGGGTVRSALLGRFNVSNLIAAAGTLALLGMEWCDVLYQLELMQPMPGRMLRLGGERGQPVVVVDHAQTPDVLDQALLALRSHLHGRMVCVVGCSGESLTGDPSMAQVAESRSDRIILTSDNQRFGMQESIFANLVAGKSTQDRALLEPDREQAIRAAIRSSGEGDIVLIAGSGPQSRQEMGDRLDSFNDEAVVREALEAAA